MAVYGIVTNEGLFVFMFIRYMAFFSLFLDH